MYLEEETQKKIREEFEEKSEISLEHFLITTKYEELINSLEKCSWKSFGPSNFRRFEVFEILENFNP